MNLSGLPSISIILTGHNEAHCIRDAIRSVFNQDYEGQVEVILSDDGSTDETFAVMQEMAAQYRGPYRVLLNRNETPLGRGGHIRQLAEMASYEWILRQDGDDCSFPWRCRFFAQAVMKHPDAVMVVANKFINVYEEPGVVFEFPPFPEVPLHSPQVVLQQGVYTLTNHFGCAIMIKKNIFEWSRSLPMTDNFEDDLMGFHAWLQGKTYEILDTPLYYYRFAGKNIFAVSSAMRFTNMKTAIAFEERRQKMMCQLKKSKKMGLELCENLLNKRVSIFRSPEELLAEIEERKKAIANIECQQNWWNYPFRKRWKLRGIGKKEIARCFPQKVYFLSVIIFFKLKKIKKFICKTSQSPSPNEFL